MSESKPKWTPGPWKYVAGAGNGCLGDDKVGGIADVAEGWWIAEICGDCPGWEANARLMAAAPDLYAELEDAIGEIENTAHCTRTEYPSNAARLAAKAARYRQALAKARGEETP